MITDTRALPVLVTPTCDLLLRHPANEAEKWELLGSLREPSCLWLQVLNAQPQRTPRHSKERTRTCQPAWGYNDHLCHYGTRYDTIRTPPCRAHVAPWHRNRF